MVQNVKIFDRFLFLNEIELLELRLNELYEVVDYFVIVPALKTFSGKDKPLYFLQDIKQFEKFLDKIIYLPVLSPPVNAQERWSTQSFQRNYIIHGLGKAEPDDIVMISDCDEIWDKHLLDIERETPYVFEHQARMFYMNIYAGPAWWGTTVLRRSQLTAETPPQYWRERKDTMEKVCGGWHFSHLGGKERVAFKIHSCSHKERDTEEGIYKAMRTIEKLDGPTLPLTREYFPEYVIVNKERFGGLMK